MTNDSKLSDGDFLQAFVERVQPVTYWPKWEVQGLFHPVLKEARLCGVLWKEYRLDNGAWGYEYGSNAYDPHEAAELVRGRMRGWLIEWAHERGLVLSVTYSQKGVNVEMWDKRFPQKDEAITVFCLDDNTALLAAFDAIHPLSGKERCDDENPTRP